MCKNPLVPINGKVVEIINESRDVKTFRVKPESEIKHLPGQCAMLSLFGIGEAIFSISSSPNRELLDFSIKKTGKVTDVLHEIEEGQQLGIRGPYGNHFPAEEIKGKNLLFVGGGIGLAPLRSLIEYALDNRKDYGKLRLIYGSRTPEDLIFHKDIFEKWPRDDFEVNLTVDAESPNWNGYVGYVPQYLEELAPSPKDTVAITCGPPIMIKYVLQTLERLGFKEDQVVTTLEYKMKCGVGKCGRCNIDDKYVCKDGPVFYLKELNQLKGEF